MESIPSNELNQSMSDSFLSETEDLSRMTSTKGGGDQDSVSEE